MPCKRPTNNHCHITEKYLLRIPEFSISPPTIVYGNAGKEREVPFLIITRVYSANPNKRKP
jgi:hypothetical protein